MRKIFLFFAGLALLFLTHCTSTDSDQFTVQVTLRHLPVSIRSALLEEVRVTDTRIIDTAAIDPVTGKFTFTGFAGEEGLYRVKLEDSTLFYLVINAGTMSVEGDYNHPEQLTVTGSPASAALNGFLEELNKRSNGLRHSLDAYDTLKAAGASDSLLAAGKTSIRQQAAALSGFLLHTARTAGSPAVAVFALSLLHPSEAPDALQGIYDSLTQRFPHASLAQAAADAYHKKMNDSGADAAITVGDMAPPVSYPDPEGKMISLAAYRGKYVLVDFWASWCAPCRQGNPYLVKAWNLYNTRNFSILGVSLDTKKESWIKAIREDGLVWNQVSDLKGWNSAPAADYHVQAIPANFLVDPQGRVIAVDLQGDSLLHKLEEVLP